MSDRETSITPGPAPLLTVAQFPLQRRGSQQPHDLADLLGNRNSRPGLLTSTVRYCTVDVMRRITRKGAEDARNQLPALLEAAENGRSTVITRRGRPVAVLAPFMDNPSLPQQQPLLPLAGSGRGLWGRDSSGTLDRLRDEWSR